MGMTILEEADGYYRLGTSDERTLLEDVPDRYPSWGKLINWTLPYSIPIQSPQIFGNPYPTILAWKLNRLLKALLRCE